MRKLGLQGDPNVFRLEMEDTPETRRLQVFHPEHVKRMAATSQSVDSDVHKRNEAIAQLMELRGPLRRIGVPLGV